MSSSSAAITATTATTAAATGTRTLDVTLKLPQLQNLCKRDPVGYREDYDAQCRRLTAELQVLQLQQHGSSNSSGGGADHRVVELIQFTAAVSSSSYKGAESDRVARQLQGLLTTTDAGSSGNVNAATANATSTTSISSSNSNLPKDVRKACVSALILMRNKGAVAPLDLLPLFFNLMVVTADKALRELLYRHMVNDIRNINKKGKRDDKVNRSVQTFLHKTVQSCNDAGASSSSDNNPQQEMAAKRAVDMVCELYRRRVWTDDRTVAILASAVQSPILTVASRAMRFFLNIEEKMAHDERVQHEEHLQETSKAVDYHLHSKKTCKRQRQTKRALKNKERAGKRRQEGGGDWLEQEGEEHPENDKGVQASKKLYPAIELLRDPQGLAEAVFRRLRSGNNMKFESKMLMINFITRLTGNHELLLLPLYSFLQKYLGGHQRDVTAILAYTVQACHEQVPPDEIYGLLKTIAHNFITERCSEEQMAVGINAVRAIVGRVPSVLNNNSSDNEDHDLTASSATDNNTAVAMDMEAFARDLAAYANHRDRSVAVAGKAWTNFVRQTHPGLLQGKDRGLQGSALYRAGVGGRPARYGERRDVATGVEGADLLVEYESKKRRAVAKKRMQQQPKDAADTAKEDEVEEEEDGGSEDGSGEWQDVVHSDNDDGDDGGEVEEEEEEAPQLVCLDGESAGSAQLKEEKVGDEEEEDDEEAIIDLSQMSVEERNKLKQQVSSTRVFTTADFVKMRKLVEREERAKRDPREAARRKRAIARGEEFEALSGSDSDDSDDEEDEVLQIKGAVNPADIMALASRKRQSKADKLEKILAGRSKFESKQREGGSTNIEKTRKKNFLMSKFSKDARRKGRGKGGLQKKKREMAMSGTHQAKKRRRKT